MLIRRSSPLTFALVVLLLAPANVQPSIADPFGTRHAGAAGEQPAKRAVSLVGDSTPTASTASQARVEQSLSALPLYFVENKGQTDSHVAFYIQGSDKTIYFTPAGVTFALTAPVSPTTSLAAGPTGPTTSRLADRSPFVKQPATAQQRWAVKLDFVGANPNVHPIGESRAQAVFSYFKGPASQRQAGLRTYTQIRYPNLWPGIDLVYSGQVNLMKYEFVVRPGADPAQIQLAYRGANAVRLTADGQLEVSTPLGSFRDAAPVAYQIQGGQRVPVAMHYRLAAAGADRSYQYSFHLEPYDHSLPLVLDPAVLVYAGYIGGSGGEGGNAIAVDSAGNVYVTGYTGSDQTTFPVTVGPDLTYNGGTDAFVAKVNAAGTALVYAGYIGGSGLDWSNGIAVDNSGNAYITGYTLSDQTSFPVMVGPDLTYNGGSSYGDAFVAKVNAAGTALVYAGYIGGSNDDVGSGIAVDGAGNAYITGDTVSDQTSFPVTGGPDLTYNGGDDTFVAKVNAAGTALVYAGYIGGAGVDRGYGIAVDGASNAYVTGFTSSDQTSFPVTVGPDLTYNGGDDAFVAKVNAAGTALLYAGYIGGAGYDEGRGIAVDSGGNAYITGATTSDQTSFPVTVGPDLTYHGGQDAFVAKINAAGTALVYAGYIGGSSAEAGTAIAIDASGNAYVTGFTGSDQTSFPVTGGPDSTYNGGVGDAFVAKTNAAGTVLVYAGYIGGTSYEIGQGIVVDGAGNAYVAGDTQSDQTSFPVTVGPGLTFNGGSHDTFVAKVTIVNYISGTVTDAGSAALSGVAIWAGPAINATTDANGDYTLTTVLTGTYVLTPTLAGYSFSPTTRTVNVPPDATGQDFVASLAPNTISGHITTIVGGVSLPGVSISAGPGISTASDVNGYYALTNLLSGTYVLTPTLAGYCFSPVVHVATVPPAAGAQDFLGLPEAFSVTVPAVQYGAQVAITNFGSAATCTSDVYYDQLGATVTSYSHVIQAVTTVTDTLVSPVVPAGYIGYAVIQSNQPGITATATPPGPTLYSVTGHVLQGTSGLPGVTVSAGSASALTDISGTYTIAGLLAGNYTLAPTLSGYVFSPPTRPISVPPNATGQDFTASTLTDYAISGRVTNASYTGLPGVTVSAGPGGSAITDGSGYYTINNVLAGTYTLMPILSGATFSPPPRSVTVPPDKTGQDFVRVANGPMPIVMVPGFGGLSVNLFSGIGCTEADKTLTMTRQYVDSYFGPLDQLLAQTRPVFYARLVSNPCFTPSLDNNVQYLKTAIDDAMLATGYSKVILVAHSMGGLVSRAYIENSRIYRGDVDSLFTLGSPHHGVPHDLLTFTANGFTALGDLVFHWGTFCENRQPGMCDLSVTGMDWFNQQHVLNPDVTYYFLTGDAPTLSRNPIGQATDALFLFQPNDGIVALDSGIGNSLVVDSKVSLHRYTNDENHNIFGTGALYDWPYFGPRWNLLSSTESKTYTECLKPVLVDSPPATCASTTANAVSAATTSSDFGRTVLESGTLLPGETATRTVTLDGGVALFTAQWYTGTLSMTLVAPDNQVIDATYATSHPAVVSYTVAANGAAYYLPNALGGAWQVVVQAGAAPISGTAYSTLAGFATGLTLAGGADRLWYAPGTNATLTATLGSLPASAWLTATVFAGDITTTIPLSPTGGGHYQGIYTVPPAPGYAAVQLRATGVNTASLPFERELGFDFQITPNTFALDNVYSEAPFPYPGLAFYQSLTVTVGINAFVSGTVGLSADLADANGHFVAHSLTIQDVVTGTTGLALRFEGADIFASQRNGPFKLTDLLLTDETSTTLAVAEAQNVYTTASYSYTSFAAPQFVYLPLVRR